MGASDFRVPYAIDLERRLVSAEEARPGVDHECPSCGHAVRVRRQSERARRHLHHVVVGASCNEDVCVHKAAAWG
jgi:predicted RNA-binding Zn-ribbon protein involved in translation (DUF1610 family)